MLPSNDIFSSGWTKVVFAGRNQAYGAYKLRQTSERRLLFAFFVTIMLFSALSGYSFYRFNHGAVEDVFIPQVLPTVMTPPPPMEDIVYNTPPPAEKPQPKVAIKTTANVVPIIVQHEPTESDIKTQEELLGLNTGSTNIDGVDSMGIFEEPPVAPTPTGTGTSNKTFTVVEQMPEFPGGNKALLEYLAKNTMYPPIAREYGIEGTVFVTFVVDRTGQITDAAIAKGTDKHLEKEALRVVKAMPVWKPGKQNGREVKVQYTVPIKFVLNDR